MIYVGIDDTDIKDSPGTNKLARHLIERLHPDYESLVAIRHQLLFDPRIPYTSKNSSASILFRPAAGGGVKDLTDRIRRLMRAWFVEGSDPGLCVTERVPPEITAFGQRCKAEIVTQYDARSLAAEHGIHLEGLGGTEGGVIGALAAVGLVAGGEDGRVVNIGNWPDDLSGPQEVSTLHDRGVAEIVCMDSHEPITDGCVDVGKHLRPNYRGRRVVLFVTPSPAESRDATAWQAVRLL
jgi:hypothetical protein